MAKLTEQQFLARTLSPTERGNRRTVDRQKDAYKHYLERVSFYGDKDALLEEKAK